MPISAIYHEKELLQRISEGDEQAFTILFRHYYPPLRHVVTAYALSEMDLEDILHETFIRVWLSRDKLVMVEQLDAWLCRIASNECLRMIAKNGRKKQNEQSFHQIQTQATPEEKMYVTELNQLVADAIEIMPARRKQIFRMSRTEGLKPAEIAVQLDLSVSTVKNALVEALKDIRAYLEAAGIVLPWGIILPVILKLFF